MGQLNKMLVTLQVFFMDLRDRKNDRGATAVEYGLIVALIAGAIIVAVTALGGSIRDMFNTIAGLIHV